jgi:hypothetical protein
MKLKKLWLYCTILVFFLGCSIDIYKTSITPYYESQKLSETLSTQKLFLWFLLKQPADEDGYVSLTLDKKFSANNIEVQNNEDVTKRTEIIFNRNLRYVIDKPQRCENINPSFKKIYDELGEGKVLCVFRIDSGFPRMLVLGDKANEMIFKMKEGKKNTSATDLRIKRYVVKSESEE